MLRGLLPDYRLLTTVKAGDGRTASFWHDSWLHADPLAVAMSSLYSHARDGEASVRQVLMSGLQSHLAPRLTAAA